jgi:hypothetical protein
MVNQDENAKTVEKQIFEYLELGGFDVYFPQNKSGECTSNYVVVSEGVTADIIGTSSNRRYYEILCYVPAAMYSDLRGYVNSVKKRLDGLFPMVRNSNMESEPFFDTMLKAHMISVTYHNNFYAGR